MISKAKFNINHPSTLFCRTPELIENYDEAIKDTEEVWACHHRDECKTLPSGIIVIRTMEELNEIGRYYDCPPNELIFLREKEHAGLHMKYRNLDKNSELNKRRIDSLRENSKKPEYRKKLSKALKGHIKSDETRLKLSLALKGRPTNRRNIPFSDFGRKYIDHYGYSESRDGKQYRREYAWYKKHNNTCRWEIENE
jgi:hypothetical protein